MNNQERAQLSYILAKMHKALTAMYVDNNCDNVEECNWLDLHEGIDELESAIELLIQFKGDRT